MNFLQTTLLLCFSLSFLQFNVRCHFSTAEEIRLKEQEAENEKIDYGADNHNAGFATIPIKRRRSVNSNWLPWNIDRLDQRHLPLDGEFCPAATGAGVDVYIIGTGINYDHEVFNGRASFGGYDVFGGNGKDCNGHGTHLAGLAVGNPTGVAHGANVYSIKIMNCNNGGPMSNAAKGIYHVIQRAKITGRRSVITLAFVITRPGLGEAVKNAISHNIVVVSSTGVYNDGPFCGHPPANSPGVINVGAVQRAEDNKYPGQHMLIMHARYGRCLHIFAPGKSILSASHMSNTELISRTGNQVACAIVAGVAATLLQRFPDYTPYQIREQLIRESTKDVINFHTRNGQILSSVIAETTSNRFVYAGKCINRNNGPSGLQRVKGKKDKQGDLHKPRPKEEKGKKKKIIIG